MWAVIGLQLRKPRSEVEVDRDRAKCPDNVLIDCPAFAQTLSAGGGGEEMEQFGSARHRAEDCTRNSVLRRVLATGGRWGEWAKAKRCHSRAPDFS